MCTGDSELEKFVEEFRALPAKTQRRLFAEVARELGVRVEGTAVAPRRCPPEAGQ
jgi:hypothetical protein